jgi:hypothetical protein
MWKGRADVTGDMGELLRVGDFLIPRSVTFTFTGSNGEPDVLARFEVREGRPQCVEFKVTAKDCGRHVRTSDIEVWKIDAMTASVYAQLSLRSTYDPGTNVTTAEPITDERGFWSAINDIDAAVKAPMRGVTRAELEQVAKLYREHIGARPVRQIAALMGYGSERTAARRVEQARDAGLLPPTTPGKRKA